METKLKQQWPHIRVEKSSHSETNYTMTWSTLDGRPGKVAQSGTHGSLRKEGKEVVLEGYPKEDSEFVVWFQQYPQQPLWLFDEGANFHIKLIGKTAEDVLKVMVTGGFKEEELP